MNKELLNAYEILKEDQIADVNSKSTILRHKKTGAKVAVLENDDDNKVFYIGFRTPPKDSTGVAHIMEHSVLCGSKDFPIKDPFIELAKGSLNTFLNAMTYPDKTVYPVASCNDKDFMNLIHVYLDAVFHPNIYKEEKIFRQEGWHYEMEDKDSPLTINGVVYSEMKGAFSSPDDVLDREVLNSLYPDTAYGVESGGDPDNIPDLTYEDFMNFHKQYYHPSNSYIYLYGDGDMAKRLQWIDEHYLCNYEMISVDSFPGMQDEYSKPVDIAKNYPITDEEDEANNTYLTYNAVCDKATNLELNFAFNVIDYALCSAQGTPIKKALVDAGIGTEVYSMYCNGICQPYYSIVAKNANAKDHDRFISIVEDTLKKVIAEGFDKNALYAGLNILEFKHREADYGNYPKGLIYGLGMFDTWLYDDEMVFDMIACDATFAKLKKLIETDYFEKLVEQYILNNNHKTYVMLEPKKGLTQIKEDELAKKLENYKASLSSEDIDKIINDCKALKEYQSEPESAEALRSIPKLKLEDLEKKAKPAINELMDFDKIPVLYHDIFTNGILYLNTYFRFKNIPKDCIPYVSLLALILGSVDTKNYSFEQLGYEINKKTGSLHPAISIFAEDGNKDNFEYGFGIAASVLYTNIEEAFELINEIVFTSNLADKKRLKEIISENRSMLLAQFTSSGHVVAANRAVSYFSKAALASEYLNGIDFYDFLCAIDDHFDEKADEIIDNLKLINDYIFDKNKLFIDITGTKDVLDEVREHIIKFNDNLSESTMVLSGDDLTPEIKNEGFTTSAQIQYVCRAGDFKDANLDYTGALLVLKTIMGYEYLWNEVRVKGGAYGCMSLYRRSGDSYFTSYRDPNLTNTIDIYENAADYVASFEADDETMVKFIIGTLSGIDTPKTPKQQGHRSLVLYLTKISDETIQNERNQVLNCTVEDIRALSKHINAFMSKNALCVVGNSGNIKDNESIFGCIKPLA